MNAPFFNPPIISSPRRPSVFWFRVVGLTPGEKKLRIRGIEPRAQICDFVSNPHRLFFLPVRSKSQPARFFLTWWTHRPIVESPAIDRNLVKSYNRPSALNYSARDYYRLLGNRADQKVRSWRNSPRPCTSPETLRSGNRRDHMLMYLQ